MYSKIYKSNLLQNATASANPRIRTKNQVVFIFSSYQIHPVVKRSYDCQIKYTYAYALLLHKMNRRQQKRLNMYGKISLGFRIREKKQTYLEKRSSTSLLVHLSRLIEVTCSSPYNRASVNSKVFPLGKKGGIVQRKNFYKSLN